MIQSCCLYPRQKHVLMTLAQYIEDATNVINRHFKILLMIIKLRLTACQFGLGCGRPKHGLRCLFCVRERRSRFVAALSARTKQRSVCKVKSAQPFRLPGPVVMITLWKGQTVCTRTNLKLNDELDAIEDVEEMHLD